MNGILKFENRFTEGQTVVYRDVTFLQDFGIFKKGECLELLMFDAEDMVLRDGLSNNSRMTVELRPRN